MKIMPTPSPQSGNAHEIREISQICLESLQTPSMPCSPFVFSSSAAAWHSDFQRHILEFGASTKLARGLVSIAPSIKFEDLSVRNLSNAALLLSHLVSVYTFV